MDPNNNQPADPQNQAPDAGQQPVPPAVPSAPDGQQGLGGTAPQPPAAGSVTPGAMPGQVSGTMPAGMSPEPAVPGVAPGMPTMDMSPMSRMRKIPKLFIVAGVVLVVILIVVVTYFMFLKESPSATDAAKKSANSAASSASDMSKLAHVTMTVPETIAGYKSRSTGVDTVKDFVSDDSTCEFIAGTVTAAQLPGADLNAIVSPQLKQLKDGGATVKGPNAGKALILKEQGGSKSYTMPTLDFEFSQDKKHATVHYSAVILTSTDRVVVNRTCINKDGAVDSARMAALDEIAKTVTVK